MGHQKTKRDCVSLKSNAEMIKTPSEIYVSWNTVRNLVTVIVWCREWTYINSISALQEMKQFLGVQSLENIH